MGDHRGRPHQPGPVPERGTELAVGRADLPGLTSKSSIRERGKKGSLWPPTQSPYLPGNGPTYRWMRSPNWPPVGGTTDLRLPAQQNTSTCGRLLRTPPSCAGAGKSLTGTAFAPG